MDLMRELVVQLEIKLGCGRGFDDRRIEIVARVVDWTRRQGKGILSVQQVPDRAHQGLGNYFRAIGGWINRKKLPVAISRTRWIRVDIEGVEDLHGHGIPVGILRQCLGEVALPLQCSRNSRADQVLREVPLSFQVNQKESLSFEDGTAQGKSVLIVCPPRPRYSVPYREKIVGVEPGPLPKPPATPVKLVGARLHQNIHHGPAVAAKLRREAVIL